MFLESLTPAHRIDSGGACQACGGVLLARPALRRVRSLSHPIQDLEKSTAPAYHDAMATIFDDEEAVFHVVMNAERQYSIWPEYMDIPDGWEMAGKTATKRECMEYIDQVWTDMRPASLRAQMDGAG